MAKKLKFEYMGKEYKLEFTIEIVKRMDKAGIIAQIANVEHPLTMTEDLFLWAFEANHSYVSNNIRRNIYGEFSDTSEDGSLLECLSGMVKEVQDEMKPKGNVKWGMEE